MELNEKFLTGDVKVKDTIEIRWHGRGGQGAKTAALLLADVAFKTGKYVQGFPEYGPERMGAPITAYNRISSEPIRVHSNIYDPQYVVVVDESLIEPVHVTAGLVLHSPMLAAIVAVSGIMEEGPFLEDMRQSYQHKFAKKPEVIEGNMEALKLAFREVMK